MLYEIKEIKQYRGEPRRCWFFDHEIDLTVWYDEQNEIVGFQLCYDKLAEQHALTWDQKTGYHHHRVDDGESDKSTRGFKGIPILLMDGFFDHKRIADIFQRKSKEICNDVSQFVYEKILACTP